MINGKFFATDDFDLAGHRFLNWKWLEDLPTDGAEEGQVIAIVGGEPVWSTVTSDGIVSVAWDDITGKPSTYAPSSHTHPWEQVTSKPLFVNSITAGAGIDISATTGTVQITNSGVTSVAAGTGISLSTSVGAVTITCDVVAPSDLDGTSDGYSTGEVPTWNATTSEFEPGTPSGGGGGDVGFIVAVKSSDEIKTSDNTPAPDSDLKVDLDANKTYAVICQLMFSAHSTPDFKSEWYGPTGIDVRMAYDLDSPNALLYTTASAGPTSPGSGTTAYRTIQWHGIVTMATTAGTFGVEWSQNTSHSASTILRAGSYMLVFPTS